MEYVLDIPGSDLALAFPHGVISGGGWEGAIPGSNDDLIGQSDGLVTRLTYAQIKYSWLVSRHEASVARVEVMDAALVSSFPDCRIVRIDELLLNEWEQQRGEDLRMATNAFDALLRWLRSQDPLHWQAIS